jgi:hypothetical protein
MPGGCFGRRSPQLSWRKDNGTEEIFDAAGAPQQIVPDVDPSHPAVDADPRANTTVDQNRIDFNDPTISGQEAVERALAKSETDKGE